MVVLSNTYNGWAGLNGKPDAGRPAHLKRPVQGLLPVSLPLGDFKLVIMFSGL
jgi:hypothetical protein